MKTVTAGEFKQTCLRLLDEVSETGEPIVVTKRGRPVAQVVPFRVPGARDWGEALRGTVQFVGDIVAPAAPAEEWEATRE